MKFENKGKWLKEAEDKLAAYDTHEHPDFLDGDNKVCTFEDDEMHDFEEDELDIVEEDDTLDSPEEEEDAIVMSEAKGSYREFIKMYINKNPDKLNKKPQDIYFDIAKEWNTQEPKPDYPLYAFKDNAITYIKQFLRKNKSSQKNEARHKEPYKGYDIIIDEANRLLIEDKKSGKLVSAICKPGTKCDTINDRVKLAKKAIDTNQVTFDRYDGTIFIESSQKNEDSLPTNKIITIIKPHFYGYKDELDSDERKALSKGYLTSKNNEVYYAVNKKVKFKPSRKMFGSTEYTVSFIDSQGKEDITLDHILLDAFDSSYFKESSQKNEANIDEEAAYKLAELLCGNINYKQAEFTNIRRQMRGHKLKVDFKGKTITINCLS